MNHLLLLFFVCFIRFLLKTTTNKEQLQLCEPLRHFTVDRDIKPLLQCDCYACRDMCAFHWITFQMELFARKTLHNIVLDLCTLHMQTRADMACILFSPGDTVVSEMKQTVNISCLLRCRYYAVSTGAGIRTAAPAKKTHKAVIQTTASSLIRFSRIFQIY